MFSVGHYLSEHVNVLMRLDETMIERMAHVLVAAWRGNNTVYCCGNGGSAATASHVAADLVKLTAPGNGRRLRVLSLTENLASITAIANDTAYEEVFAEQLRSFVQPGDVLIAFSTSGSSPNVIRAVRCANAAGAVTLGVTGRSGFKLKMLAHHALVVQSTDVQHVEDASLLAGHLLCLRVRQLVASEASHAGGEMPSALRGLTGTHSAL